MPLAEIAGAITGIKSAIEITKTIGKSIKDTETNTKFIQLIQALSEATIQLASVQQELIARDTKIRELEGQLKIKDEYEFRENFVWKKGSTDGDERYCPKCYQADDRPIRLQKLQRDMWQCLKCGNHIEGKNYRPPDVFIGGGLDSGSGWMSR